jgi:hypothetical protein
MRPLAYLLLTVSLIAGALAAATAYLAPLDALDETALLDDNGDAKLTLSAPAGKIDPRANPDLAASIAELHVELDADRKDPKPVLLVRERPQVDLTPIAPVETVPTGQQVLLERESVMPVGRAGDPLTPDLLAALRDAEVESVKVKSFDLMRWRFAALPGVLVFGLACIGLLAGAGLVRAAAKKEIDAHADQPSGAQESPEQAFEAIHAEVVALKQALPGLASDHERNAMIVARLGVLQSEHIQAIIDARAPLIARLGLGGFAEFMDRFAAADRKINRAWSAAADEAFEEAMDALEAADALLPGAAEKLQPRS